MTISATINTMMTNSSRCDFSLATSSASIATRLFDDLAFRGLMRLRGVESNRRFAEGFHVHKLTV